MQYTKMNPILRLISLRHSSRILHRLRVGTASPSFSVRTAMASLPDVKPTPALAEVRGLRRRTSGEVMTRENTIGAGLNQLDEIIGELHDIKRSGGGGKKASALSQQPKHSAAAYAPTGNEPAAARGRQSIAPELLTAALVLALGVLAPMVTHQREVLDAAGWLPAVCEDTCAHANDGSCDDGGVDANGSACLHGFDCGDCGKREMSLPSWAIIVASLLLTGVLTLGVRTVGEMLRAATRPTTAPGGASWTRVPLTDARLGMGMLNKFANSAQVREKGLKVLQYVFKGVAYSKVFSTELSKQLKDLSKATSIARRFFKFCRWVKHFEDLAEANEHKASVRARARAFSTTNRRHPCCCYRARACVHSLMRVARTRVWRARR